MNRSLSRPKPSPPGQVTPASALQPDRSSALLLVDLQNDFMPGGALGIPESASLIPTVNAYIKHFSRNGWPILATRDWHPPNHCSFREQGGPFPAHCVQGSRGAQFHTDLVLPPGMMVISKGTNPKKDSTSAFEESSLEERLEDLGVKKLFVLGAGSRNCVAKTVLKACQAGWPVVILQDAIPGAALQSQDQREGFAELTGAGAMIAAAADLGVHI